MPAGQPVAAPARRHGQALVAGQLEARHAGLCERRHPGIALDAARRAFTDALAADDGNADAHANLALVMLAQRQFGLRLQAGERRLHLVRGIGNETLLCG